MLITKPDDSLIGEGDRVVGFLWEELCLSAYHEDEDRQVMPF